MQQGHRARAPSGGVENFQDVATASYLDLSNAELIYMQWIFSQAFGGIYLREVFGICVYKYWLYYFVLFLHKTLRGFINCFILSFCGNWSVCVLIIYQRDVGICDQYCTVAIC